VSGVLITSFNATLPLHVREAFHWGGMPAGLLFAALQGPRIVLAPFVGCLKDRMGSKKPTVLAFILLAPLIWFLGLPGDDDFPTINGAGRGPGLYVATILLVGIHLTLLNGSGTFEATGKSHISFSLNPSKDVH
jgi:nitrate/nitrite transporter NarK